MKMEGADARADENLFCLAVLVAALPVPSGQDRFWEQEYASTTGRVWHYSMSKTNKKKTPFELGNISKGHRSLCKAAQ